MPKWNIQLTHKTKFKSPLLASPAVAGERQKIPKIGWRALAEGEPFPCWRRG